MRLLSTLRGQFVVVVAAAVILSNLVVVALFETAREGEITRVRLLALADRAGNAFDLLADLPTEQRDAALRAMSSNFLRYTLVPGPPFPTHVRDDEEIAMTTEVKAAEQSKQLGEIRIRSLSGSNAEIPSPFTETLRANNPAVEIAQALSPTEWLLAHVERPQLPPTYDLLWAAALGTVLTGGAAAWLAGRVSRPLSALAAAADEVARGNTAPVLKPAGPDDIRVAAEAFNAMSDRVTRTLESHRQLLSAVGHDLRTPLAAMRITAEFVDDQEVRGRLTRNLDELQSLTEAVLSAVRSERGEEMRRVDLGSLIQSVCDDLVDLGEPVEVDIAASAPCVCRPSEIRRAVRNLVENAVRYGGGAHVALKTEGNMFVAVIDDSGPGIPQDKLERVFEPFIRLEESRSNATGGSGLGLTLARAIAREHGGDVVLQNRSRGGLRATLRIPREGHGAKGAASGVADRAAHT